MADTKTSALTALTGANLASADVIPVVDTSATTTKKMTITEFILGLLSTVGVADGTSGSAPAIRFNGSGGSPAGFNYNVAGSSIVYSTGGAAAGVLAYQVIRTGSTGVIGFSSSQFGPDTNQTDSGFSRKAAGIVELCNGTRGTVTGTALSTGAQTVAQLPAAATAGAGARSFVTDASATTFLSTVAAGGANKVPVVSDGTNWLIG